MGRKRLLDIPLLQDCLPDALGDEGKAKELPASAAREDVFGDFGVATVVSEEGFHVDGDGGC